MRSTRYYFPIIVLVACAITSYLSLGIVDAAQFKSNLKLGAQIDLGPGKIKIAKVSEAIKTPINGNSPKRPGNKFVVIETIVTSIKNGSKLSSGGIVLVTRAGLRFNEPAAYGKVRVFDKLSDFEAIDGAVVYAYNVSDSLNVFFEVPESTNAKDLQLFYVAPKE